MTDKTLSINGIITEQTIVKNFEDSETTNDVSKYLTAHEVSQLIHSYVDSSFMQPHQNLNKSFFFVTCYGFSIGHKRKLPYTILDPFFFQCPFRVTNRGYLRLTICTAWNIHFI